MSQVIREDRTYLNLIKVVSVVIPVVVALLLFIPSKVIIGEWTKALPHVNAVINSITSVLLVLALIAVKRQNITLHKNLMLSALLLGTLFLISYVLYHATSESTIYGDLNADGVLDDAERALVSSSRGVYVILLLSHIGFSIVVVPFVLLAFYFALSNQVTKHKKIVKFTFPIWLYVSVTGVTVYLLISPYYS